MLEWSIPRFTMIKQHRQAQMSRVDVWNSTTAAKEYVPGLGRGAQGFTTRSDIGPARFTPAVTPNEVCARLRLEFALQLYYK